MKSTTLLKFIFISFLFICQAGMAQVKIGAKAGYSAGRLTDNSDNIYAGDFESSSGVDIGLTAEFPISELFSLQTELIYTQRGGTRDGLQPIPVSSLESLGSLDDLNYVLSLQGKDPVTDENPMYADFSNSFELNYLEIPILGKLGWGTTWRFYVEAGPYIGFLIDATSNSSGNSKIYLDAEARDPLVVINPNFNPEDPSTGPLWVAVPPQNFEAETSIKDDLNTWVIGFHAGAGLIREITEKHEIYLGFRGSWSYNTLQKDKIYGESHVGGLVFSLGYAYTL